MLARKPHRRSFCVVFIVTAGALSVPTLASADRKIKVSGVARSGYEAAERIGPEAEVEIRGRTKRVGGTRAVVKIEGRYFRDRVEVEDAFIDHRFGRRVRLQVGVNKKRIGMEYQQSSRERLTPARSLIYEKMETLGIVGRQLNLRLVTRPFKGLAIDALVGTDGNRNSNAAISIRRKLGSVGVGYWGLIERHRIDKDYIAVTAHAISAWILSQRFRCVVELIGGIDSFETEAKMVFEGGRRVWFAGPKLELARRFEIASRLTVEPVLQASIVAHDTTNLGHNTFQLLSGLNGYVGGIVLSVNVDHTSASERVAPYERTNKRTDFRVQARLHF